MSATVVGELTADESTIVLIGAGPDHDVAAVARELRLLTPTISSTNPPGALRLPVTWPAVIQLAATFGPAWRPQPRLVDWIARQIRARTTAPPDALRVTPPAGLTPRPYQIEGAHLIASTGRVLIFDEPGTGKTITTILGLVERAATGATVLPALVICPASVIDPWLEALRAWAPRWSSIAWRGTPSQRRALAGTADVYVASYDTARHDAHSTTPKAGHSRILIELGAASVVADECHLIKNAQSARSRAVRRLAEIAEHFVGLSGTPITHHPGDLWPALTSLAPGAWPSKERWISRYLRTANGNYGPTVLGLLPDTEPEFRQCLLGAHRRVAKADVLTQLPPKVYSVRTVDIPTGYRKAYDDMESRMLAELPDSGELSAMGVLAQLTRLSQMACAAADVTVTTEIVEINGLPTEKEHQHVTLKAPSWKVDALLEVLAERGGSPVVTCAPSRQLMTLAGQAARNAGYRVGFVIGEQSPRQRTEAIRAFQSGELDLICVTTGAGGVGITLTAASTLVFLMRPWSLVESSQMEDRCHRIGSEQHDHIEIIDIQAHNTIDTRIRSVLREKAGQLANLVQDPRIVAQLLGGASVTRLSARKAG